MKLCFPVQSGEGVESKVYNHFGSAPLFVTVDTETNAVTIISNGDRDHEHGKCNPLQALAGRRIDAVIVGGIGGGALGRLNQAGVKVYRAQLPTIKENIALLTSGKLPEFTLQSACGGHGKGTCAHH
jgi:predicted Fe-Mo cluster-binding NifX family protein